MNAVLYKGWDCVTHLKIGDHVWMMQLPEDLDLSQRACPQDVSIRIIVLNLELLNCHDRLGPHNSALHDQACPTAPCLAQVLQHTVQYSTVQYGMIQRTHSVCFLNSIPCAIWERHTLTSCWCASDLQCDTGLQPKPKWSHKRRRYKKRVRRRGVEHRFTASLAGKS